MQVLIAKQNKEIIEKLLDRPIKLQERTEHTGVFKITLKTFKRLQEAVKNAGYNPYALMTW